MIGVAIFNRLSGRYLEDWKTGDYLIFSSAELAKAYIHRKKLNKEHFKVRGVVKNDLP